MNNIRSTSTLVPGWPLVTVRKDEFDALVAENARLREALGALGVI